MQILSTVLDVASIGDLEMDLGVMQILSTDLETVLDVTSMGDLEVMQILSTDLETVLDVASIGDLGMDLEVMQILSIDQEMDLVEKIEPGDQVERMKVVLGANRGVTEDPDEMIFLLRQNELTALFPLSCRDQ